MSTPIVTASVFEHIRQGKKVEVSMLNHQSLAQGPNGRSEPYETIFYKL
jgi:hypothetical protein